MFKQGRILENIYLGLSNGCTLISRTYCTDTLNRVVPLKHVLVVSKLSRYEFEQRRNQNLNSKQLEMFLKKRGTDYDKLVKFHDLHKKFEENVINTLEKLGVKVTVGNRFTVTDEMVNNADVIMPVGGDGTFLLAASRVKDNKKPVIGFNSDPNRSEGHLCLPKKYSANVQEAIKKLQKGEFNWLMRNRIRTSILSDDQILTPKYLHDVENEVILVKSTGQTFKRGSMKVVPVLALNEVFIGESLSARVSHLQMKLNGSSDTTNLKCSGLCICTGTGSTSWHLSINRLPKQTVEELLKFMNCQEENLATTLSETYNKNLIFNPDDKRLGYTIRDLISAGVWPQPKGIKSRGFATKLEVRSNCYDASLVVDGGVSFSFNDGTVAILEICPEDSLRTVILTG